MDQLHRVGVLVTGEAEQEVRDRQRRRRAVRHIAVARLAVDVVFDDRLHAAVGHVDHRTQPVVQHGGHRVHAAVAQRRHRAELVARGATGSRHYAEVVTDEVTFVRIAGQFVIALAQRAVAPRHAAAAHGVSRAVARIERGRYRQGVGAAARAGNDVAVRIAVVVQRACAQCRHHADAGGCMRAAAVGLVAITAAVVALAQDVAAGRIAVGDRAAEDACGRGQALQGIVAVVLGIRARCAARLTDQVAEAVVAVAQAVRARPAPAQRVRLARAVIIAVRTDDLSIQDLTLAFLHSYDSDPDVRESQGKAMY